jgi:hypothetical protein
MNTQKNTFAGIAKKLYDNKVTIGNYDYEQAMSILLKIEASHEEIELFKKESFYVFIEIMRLETIDSMHNMLKPI